MSTADQTSFAGAAAPRLSGRSHSIAKRAVGCLPGTAGAAGTVDRCRQQNDSCNRWSQRRVADTIECRLDPLHHQLLCDRFGPRWLDADGGACESAATPTECPPITYGFARRPYAPPALADMPDARPAPPAVKIDARLIVELYQLINLGTLLDVMA